MAWRNGTKNILLYLVIGIHFFYRDEMKSVGTREEVYNGLAMRTTGGLGRDHLIVNARGLVVSKRRSELARQNVLARSASRPAGNRPLPDDNSFDSPEPIPQPRVRVTDVEPRPRPRPRSVQRPMQSRDEPRLQPTYDDSRLQPRFDDPHHTRFDDEKLPRYEEPRRRTRGAAAVAVADRSISRAPRREVLGQRAVGQRHTVAPVSRRGRAPVSSRRRRYDDDDESSEEETESDDDYDM